MPVHIHADQTDERASATAARALSERLAASDAAGPDFLAVHANAGHDIEAIRAAFAGTGARALHGGTSCRGVMASGGLSMGEGAGLGLFAIRDPEGAYGTGLAAQGSDPAGAAREATLAALDDAARPGEAPALVWLTAAPGAEEAVIAGIEGVVGPNTPIIGGSAADDAVAGGWSVFAREGLLGDGVAVSVLFPSRPVSFAYQNGYTPAETRATVTEVEGRRLCTLDGRPAAEVYGGWRGEALTPMAGGAPLPILSDSTFHPLGRRIGEVAGVPFHLLAHPAAVHPDGSIELFATIREGETVELMAGTADSLTARAGRVAALAARAGALAPGDIAGALMVYCGGCMMAVSDRIDGVAREVDGALGGAPWLGVFSFGEQGPVLDGRNRHGNLMISCVTFAR
jgi:hypothetical protein